MGTLLGHALPGSFFLLFAVWRLVQIVRRLQLLANRCRKSTGSLSRPTFYTSATYPCCFGWCARWPMEGAAKVLVTTIGMAGELWASTDYGRAGRIIWWGDIQHVTMYLLFCVSGVVDILRWKRFAFVPPGTDFLALCLAFVGEYVIFSHHMHGRIEFDVLVHTLLLYVIGATVVTILLELRYGDSVLAALATTYFIFVQGTWFIQVGLMLYPPSPAFHLNDRPNEEDNMMIATMVFAWHLVGAFVMLLGCYVVLGRIFDHVCAPSQWESWDEVLIQQQPPDGSRPDVDSSVDDFSDAELFIELSTETPT